VVGRSSLIVTLTRQCNLRCSYCPTVKEGWPSLSRTAIDKALDLFDVFYSEGDIKLFGGEPLLEPELVRYVLESVRDKENIRWVYLSTNGLGLNQEWIEFLQQYPKAILTLSMDGRAEDHRKLRRSLPGVTDSYGHIVSLLPSLHNVPRLVVTQTIAPATAKNALVNFQHLRSLGFRRFNFLPGYFIPWRSEQLQLLQSNFRGIRTEIETSWRSNEYIYVRNLFVRAPTPFFNQGLIVDSDESIHPSNVGLSGSLDQLRERTCVGTLSDPPSLKQLQERAMEINGLIQNTVSEKIWNSTIAADRELTKFCKELMPAFVSYRKKRGNVA